MITNLLLIWPPTYKVCSEWKLFICKYILSWNTSSMRTIWYFETVSGCFNTQSDFIQQSTHQNWSWIWFRSKLRIMQYTNYPALWHKKRWYLWAVSQQRERMCCLTRRTKRKTCWLVIFWPFGLCNKKHDFSRFLDHLYLHVRPSNRVCNHCARHGTFALALIATNVSYLHSFNFLFDQIYSFLLLGRPKDIDCKVKITSLSMKKQINDEASGLWKNIDFVVLDLFQ